MTTTTPAFLPVTHVIRRAHDHSVISHHCGLDCARAVFERVGLGSMMGTTPPGPLEKVEAQLVDLATGDVLMLSGGLVPLDGIAPPEVHSWP